MAAESKSRAFSLAVARLQRDEPTTKDPFVKIRAIISKLMDDMTQKGLEEAKTHDFCDGQVKLHTSNRDTYSAELEKTNSDLAAAIALKNTTEKSIASLGPPIARLTEQLSTATKLRLNESQTNQAAIVDAQQMSDTIGLALNDLRAFYGPGPSLLQIKADVQIDQDLDEDAIPGAPKVTTDAYGGNKEQSTGVLSMLEVMQSDFDRTVSETSADEATAAAEFEKFTADAQADIQAKTDQLTALKQDLAVQKDNVMNLESSYKVNSESLKLAKDELEKLRKVCTNSEEAQEKRAKEREAEIAGLEETIKLLDFELGKEAYKQA